MRQLHRPLLAAIVAVAAHTGCSAPALSPHQAQAEAAEADGDHDAALASYAAAARASCSAEARRTPQGQRRCAQAHIGRAELLERIGRARQAAQAYRDIPDALPEDPISASTALYRAGRIHLDLGDDEQAYRLLWRTLTDYPDEGFAADALRVLVRDGRQRNADQLYSILSQLLQPLSDTAVADNLLYAMADLAERENQDLRAALGLYDKIIAEYRKSGLRDDAFWHAARVARAMGDSAGAARRYRQLLATREVAVGAGSYNSVWFDNAQLQLGLVLRDDLGDHRAALRAFAQLADDYPASILLDDAVWETARTWDALGNRDKTCAALTALGRWPDSKYELELAPALRSKRACPPPTR